jgi:hypothetical protein
MAGQRQRDDAMVRLERREHRVPDLPRAAEAVQETSVEPCPPTCMRPARVLAHVAHARSVAGRRSLAAPRQQRLGGLARSPVVRARIWVRFSSSIAACRLALSTFAHAPRLVIQTPNALLATMVARDLERARQQRASSTVSETRPMRSASQRRPSCP